MTVMKTHSGPWHLGRSSPYSPAALHSQMIMLRPGVIMSIGTSARPSSMTATEEWRISCMGTLRTTVTRHR
jgi:hypothetical protein